MPLLSVDMCSVYRGTTSDVRNLIDFIPAYLFPAGEKQIEEFWVTGISLGGHVSYLALTHEPRITLGIPIIGCPDYHTLLSRRIASGPPASGQTTLAPPVFPDSLAALIKRTDPVNSNYNLLESEGGAEKNPFWGKKILVLGGADDKLVPASIGRPFFEKLQVGPQGFKEEWIEEGCGHVCSPAMIERAGKFLWLHGLSYEKEVRSSL
jgi:pimeloyl-ACP methyl ester carboxylesterase